MQTFSAPRIAQAVDKLGIDLQYNIRRYSFGSRSSQPGDRSLRNGIGMHLTEGKRTVDATVFTKTTALEYGITGTRGFRASLRELKKTFVHPLEAEAMNPKIHGRHVGLSKESLFTSTLHDIAPYILRGLKQALHGTLSR